MESVSSVYVTSQLAAIDQGGEVTHHVLHIVAKDEWALEDGPHREVRDIFVMSHLPVSYLESDVSLK